MCLTNQLKLKHTKNVCGDVQTENITSDKQTNRKTGQYLNIRTNGQMDRWMEQQISLELEPIYVQWNTKFLLAIVGNFCQKMFEKLKKKTR